MKAVRSFLMQKITFSILVSPNIKFITGTKNCTSTVTRYTVPFLPTKRYIDFHVSFSWYQTVGVLRNDTKFNIPKPGLISVKILQ